MKLNKQLMNIQILKREYRSKKRMKNKLGKVRKQNLKINKRKKIRVKIIKKKIKAKIRKIK